MAAVLRGDAAEYAARVSACEEAKRAARVARGKVELASRYDGSYERARQTAKLAEAQAEAHELALRCGPEAMVMPVAIRCETSPAHSTASSVCSQDRLSGPLQGTVRFARNELEQAALEQRAYAFSQTVRGMESQLNQTAAERRTSAYMEAIKFDTERNLRYAQQRYQNAARPRRSGPPPLDPGVLVSMFW